MASTGIAAALVVASVFGTGLHLLSHLTVQIEDLRDDLSAQIGDVRQEIGYMRQEIRDVRQEIRAIDALYRQPSIP